jgi:hypothetical protein
MPGLTAYFGLCDVAKPKKGDYVFVSAAAGAMWLEVLVPMRRSVEFQLKIGLEQHFRQNHYYLPTHLVLILKKMLACCLFRLIF